MAGQNNNADAELDDFFASLDPLVEDFPIVDHHQQVQAPPAHVLPGVTHQQMVVVDLQPGIQLPHQQASSMIHLQHPQQAAPATPLQHQQMLGEWQATMPRHPSHHLMNELMPMLPPQYQQGMMGESSATMSLQQQEMLGQGDPSQAVMTHQDQQMLLVDPPAAYGGLHSHIPMSSPGGEEGQSFPAAPPDTDGDLGLHALQIVDEEEHLPSGGGNAAGSMNVASIPRLRNQLEMADFVAAITERMRNSRVRLDELNSLLAASSSTIRAPPANKDPSRAMEMDVLPILPVDAPPPAHRWEERDIMKSSGLRQPNPAQVTGLRMPQQQPRGASRRGDEKEETRRFVSATAAEAKEELTKQKPLLKKLSRKKLDLGFTYRRIVTVNRKIQMCEKESLKHSGSQLSKIRREVDKFLIEERGLYIKFWGLVLKESCRDLPPRRNDDEAGPSGGSGAAGAAVA